MKKLLTSLLLLTLLLTSLAACKENGAGPDGIPDAGVPGTTTTPFNFVSLGDGTCVINGLSYDTGVDTRPVSAENTVTLDVPSVSPAGEAVVGILNLGFSGVGSVPRVLLPEAYEAMLAPAKQKVATGELNNFQLKKFETYYVRITKDDYHTQAGVDALIERYPAAAILDSFYVLCTDLDYGLEYPWLAEFLAEHTNYTAANALADYQAMIEAVVASPDCTKEMLASIPYPALKTSLDQMSVRIAEGIKEIASEAFCDLECRIVGVVLPASLERIASQAFFNCNSLTVVEYKGTMEQWEAIEKAEGWTTGALAVQCTDGAIDYDVGGVKGAS